MGHGGRRPGAGAKPRTVTREKIDFYHSLLTQTERYDLWRKHLFSDDPRVALNALVYVTDRELGKAAQSLKHSGPEGDDPVRVILIGKVNGHAIQ